MAKLILICGKLCCGKTTYAKKLAKEIQAVRLSCDDIMLCLFGKDLGDKHDEVAQRVQNFLIHQAVEVYEADVSVIVDFGFWRKAQRENVTTLYKQQGITPEWHYIDIDDETWKRNIAKRNAAVTKNETLDYYVDEGLAHKCETLFEKPQPNEMDVWYSNRWSES